MNRSMTIRAFGPIAFLQRPAREKTPRGDSAGRNGGTGLRGMQHGAQAASGPPVAGGRRVLHQAARPHRRQAYLNWLGCFSKKSVRGGSGTTA